MTTPMIMETEIEIFIYREDNPEPNSFKVDPEMTVEALLIELFPDRHQELFLTVSGEDKPREHNHQLKDCGIQNGHHIHCHPHGHHRHMHRVEVIVNGKPVLVNYVPRELGKVLVERALEKSHNSGQKPENWQLRDEQGITLDQSKPVRDYKLTEHSKLFLNLKAGGGGGLG